MITELYLNGQRIDLSEDIQIQLNLSLNDLENPTEKQSTFSRTIDVTGSVNNDAVFGHIYLFDSWIVNFDPTIKATAMIFQDGIMVMEGIGQLLAVKEVDGDRSYELSVYGEIANLFRTASNYQLTDLDFSDLDHEWSQTNMQDSWTNNISSAGQGYYYPINDIGRPSFERTNTPPASALYYVEDMLPAIYLKEYVDRIAEMHGYTIESNFFETEDFKRIGIPYGISGLPLLPDALLETFLYRVRLKNMTFPIQTSNPYLANGSTYLLEMGVITPAPFFDGGNYNETSYYYQSPADQTINVQFNTTCFPDADYANITATFKLYLNGAYHSDFFFLNWDGSELGDPKSGGNVIAGLVLSAGDTIEVRMTLNNVAGSVNMRVVWAQTYWLNQISGTPVMQEGFTWDMNQTIVPNIKQSEFMASIVKAFNLYVWTDKYDKSKIYIEPWKDFYLSSTPLDWTQKWDVKKEITIEPQGFCQKKTFFFSYKNGGTFFEKRYQQAYVQPYGSRKYEVTNDFSTDEVKNELIFGITPMAGYSSSSRLYSRMYDVDENGVIKPITNGLKLQFFNYVTYPVIDGYFVFEGTTLERYPYAGHLNDPYNPTLDLSFGIPYEVYWTTNAETSQIWKYSNANLFNIFWRDYVNELTDKDAKKITLYLNLSPVDVMNLDFRQLIQINGVVFRIHTIHDYDANSSESTKVDLVKVLNLVEFQPSQFELTNGSGALIGDETKPQTITQ